MRKRKQEYRCLFFFFPSSAIRAVEKYGREAGGEFGVRGGFHLFNFLFFSFSFSLSFFRKAAGSHYISVERER